MILTVTLNAALDITHRVDRLRPHASNRVASVAQRAGGKGVNVARVLHALGHECAVTGLAGGATGAAVRAELASARLADHLVPIRGETRRTVAVVDDRDTTILLEPGPFVTRAEWARFVDHYRLLLSGAAAVVLAGSLPPGIPVDAYASLIALARAQDVPTLLDADGAALTAALAAAPDVVKPNAHELAAATGGSDPGAGAAALSAAGARAVVASLGPEGLLAHTPQGAWRARPPAPVAGNPTGAGDAAVAALARTFGRPWPERLAEAVALSAAAVAAPLAGDFDPEVRRALLRTVTVSPIASPRTGRSDATSTGGTSSPR
ncbi:1-phosphofructokinase family hexose kinase [Streptomyces sp. NPDC056161]|uniref:1-phosphofructokinase family hexose kinase n=1 Tax=Streptomyces sp. NPDC056161 TaxID=3345732 RepID=UPI0035DBB00E